MEGRRGTRRRRGASLPGVAHFETPHPVAGFQSGDDTNEIDPRCWDLRRVDDFHAQSFEGIATK